MNRHPGPVSLALLGTLLALTAPVANVCGQAAPAATATLDELKGSPSVASAGPQITAAVNAQVASLTGGNPAASAAARDALINAVSPGGGGNPTAGFLNAFAVALDAGVMPALSDPSDMVRLNAAITVARVAQRTDNAVLVGSTIALLNDKSPFVVLWGLKAARSVIPAVLQNPAIKSDGILAAVVKAANAHGTGAMGAPIAVEAYEALMLGIFEPAARKPADAELRAVIPVIQQLLQQRAQIYAKGMPPEPMAENRATLFLVNSRVWGLHNAKQKLVSVQAMSNLVGLGAQHYDAATPDQRASLAPMISNVTSAIAVVPEAAPIQAQLAPAVKINAAAAPEVVTRDTAAIVPALKTINAFSTIQPAPAVAPNTGDSGGSQPSTAPTTSGTVPATAAAIRP